MVFKQVKTKPSSVKKQFLLEIMTDVVPTSGLLQTQNSHVRQTQTNREGVVNAHAQHACMYAQAEAARSRLWMGASEGEIFPVMAANEGSGSAVTSHLAGTREL